MITLKERNDALDALERLFTGRGAWVQESEALGLGRAPCTATSPHAKCWCLSGGALKVVGGRLDHRYYPLIGVLGVAISREFWPDVKDTEQLHGFKNADERRDVAFAEGESIVIQWNDMILRTWEDIHQVIRAAKELPL